ncbi:MAG: Spo0E like sporulation regulatory protein [Clostridiales bacterium]|jgi:hypothetical protein|nr:Spo0E like sporulation regulatory protein [Clostridiales bacterium]MDK2932763.1 Spo0E like sporulation regulatory protein [Clostridiales bacterium]
MKKIKNKINIDIFCIPLYNEKAAFVGGDSMLNDQIVLLRNKLNNLLIKDADYEQIYAISIELDKLIVEYYNQIKAVRKQSGNTVQN